MNDAAQNGYAVGEDYSVFDFRTSTPQRQAEAQALSADLNAHATNLAQADERVGHSLTTATASEGKIHAPTFKRDNPGGVNLPTNPYPAGTAKHEEVDETAQKLLEYGTKLAAYNLEDPPTTEAEYEDQYHEYLELNADLAEIILEYKQEGIEFTVDAPSAPGRPG